MPLRKQINGLHIEPIRHSVFKYN